MPDCVAAMPRLMPMNAAAIAPQPARPPPRVIETIAGGEREDARR